MLSRLLTLTGYDLLKLKKKSLVPELMKSDWIYKNIF
jgi:hypothetical protein